MRCPQCASDNPAEYRFCGMCGTLLEKPGSAGASSDNGGRRHAENEASAVNATRIALGEEPPPARLSSSAPQTLSGPSFLGLSTEPERSSLGSSSQDFKYLLEDEQPKRTYWRFTLIMLILFGLGALGWLEYSRAGKAWVAPWSKEHPQTPVQASQPQPSDQPAAPATAPPTDSGSAKTDNSTGSGSTPPPAANTQPSATADNSPMKETVTPDKKAMDETAKEDTAKPDKTETTSAQPAEDNNSAGSADEGDTPEPAKPTKNARSAKSKAAIAPAPSEDDTLVASAEKYLYGRGVPQNCDRALISLRAAAQRSNNRAQSLLGSMYATGHCVPRDLPNAYRWFALASRENTDNMWVQRNLEMIWREMTPQERQLATQRAQ